MARVGKPWCPPELPDAALRTMSAQVPGRVSGTPAAPDRASRRRRGPGARTGRGATASALPGQAGRPPTHPLHRCSRGPAAGWPRAPDGGLRRGIQAQCGTRNMEMVDESRCVRATGRKGNCCERHVGTRSRKDAGVDPRTVADVGGDAVGQVRHLKSAPMREPFARLPR